MASCVLNNGIRENMGVELHRKIRLINVFCIIGLVFVVPISIQSLVSGHRLIFFMDMLALAFFGISFSYLGKTSRYRLSAHVFVHALFGLLLFFVFSGGVDGTGAVWIFVFPIVALSLYELRLGMAYALIFTLAVGVIFFVPGCCPGGYEYPFEFRVRLFCSYVVVTLLAIVYEYYRLETFNRMKAMSDQLDAMTKHDTLTGLMNRRGIYEHLRREQARIDRQKGVFSVMLGDIDHFKTVNDAFGHDTGDRVLEVLPRVFLGQIRAQDVVARWGGEEFLFLLPETDLEGAATLGEKIRRAVEGKIVIHGPHRISCTMSFGVAEIRPGTSYKKGISAADRCLLEAKARGRNQVLPEPGRGAGPKGGSTEGPSPG